ncbi:MAG: hypothetical protein RLO50_15440 [Azospirillaceae bacterium]
MHFEPCERSQRVGKMAHGWARDISLTALLAAGLAGAAVAQDGDLDLAGEAPEA